MDVGLIFVVRFCVGSTAWCTRHSFSVFSRLSVYTLVVILTWSYRVFFSVGVCRCAGGCVAARVSVVHVLGWYKCGLACAVVSRSSEVLSVLVRVGLFGLC